MENPRLEEEKFIKDTKNVCRPKKELNDSAIKDIANLFKLKKEIKGIKYIILKHNKNLFEHEEEKNYYKPVRVNNIWSNNYKIKEYQLKNISIKLEDSINNLEESDAWKTQSTIAYNFIFSLDNDEDHVMHSNVIAWK